MFRLLSVLILISAANAIPVDNGVEGEPEIECGPTSITVNFNTRNPFEGTCSYIAYINFHYNNGNIGLKNETKKFENFTDRNVNGLCSV